MNETPRPQEEVIATRLAAVIAATAERIHYAEARRANYSVMAGAIIAAGIAVFTFSLGAIDVQWMYYGAITGSLSMIVLGTVILYVFGKQTNRYPFTSATKTWKWFYRDALPDQTAFDPKPGQSWSNEKIRVEKAFADQLPQFRECVLKLADDRTNMDQDIQQAYVLHINEKYKNLYLSKLRSIFNLGLIVIAGLTITGGLIGLLFEVPSHRTISSSSSNNSWMYQTEYRLISSPKSKTVEWVVKVTVTNKNVDRPVSVYKVLARDSKGWPLPVEITYSKTLPQIIEPRQTTALFAVMKSGRTVWGAVASVDLEIR